MIGISVGLCVSEKNLLLYDCCPDCSTQIVYQQCIGNRWGLICRWKVLSVNLLTAKRLTPAGEMPVIKVWCKKIFIKFN